MTNISPDSKKLKGVSYSPTLQHDYSPTLQHDSWLLIKTNHIGITNNNFSKLSQAQIKKTECKISQKIMSYSDKTQNITIKTKNQVILNQIN